MLKKNFWLKVLAVTALSFSSISSYAAAPELKSAALGDLLNDSSVANLVELPQAAEVSAPEALKAANPGIAPEPGKDFTPVIYDKVRIKAVNDLLALIRSGKPLPFDPDGSTFKNKEGKLPAQPAGYYREYTLLTGSAPHTVKIGDKTYDVAPDLSSRGSERVIIGGGEKIYYTPDHYANFILLTVVY